VAGPLFEAFACAPTTQQSQRRLCGLKFRRLCAQAGVLDSDVDIRTLCVLRDRAVAGLGPDALAASVTSGGRVEIAAPTSAALSPSRRKCSVGGVHTSVVCRCLHAGHSGFLWMLFVPAVGMRSTVLLAMRQHGACPQYCIRKLCTREGTGRGVLQ
jgi:hypothetical protein